MNITVKRVYQKADQDDGVRILVDRLWPRGLSKDKAEIDQWKKELSPSSELRKWYNHDHSKWPDFKDRYFAELSRNSVAVNELLSLCERSKVTFLFSSKELLLNAYALKEFLEER